LSYVVCIALLLFDYSGQLLVCMPYALLSRSFVTLLYCCRFFERDKNEDDISLAAHRCKSMSC